MVRLENRKVWGGAKGQSGSLLFTWAGVRGPWGSGGADGVPEERPTRGADVVRRALEVSSCRCTDGPFVGTDGGPNYIT